MGVTTTIVHIYYFVTSMVPRYPPDITVYLYENIILGQMSHELTCKQVLSMMVVVGRYACCRWCGRWHVGFR